MPSADLVGGGLGCLWTGEGLTVTYKSEVDDLNTLIWFDGKYEYSIDAQISEDEIIKIAENIKSSK